MTIVASTNTPQLLSAIEELAVYRRQPVSATAFNVGNSFYAVNEVWRARAPKTADEIIAFYRTTEALVEQQVMATYGIDHEIVLRERVAKLLGGKINPTILDYGAGIGSMLLDLPYARKTHVDVGGVVFDYAAWRYRRGGEGESVEMIGTPDPYGSIVGRHFEVVICTEVIEHIPDPELLAERLVSLVKPGGILVATTSFHNDDGTIPMHLNLDRYTDESFERVWERLGLSKIEPHVYSR